jgi:CRP-like cAMP-binding protein
MLNPVALPNDPRQNQLLAALSPGEWIRVRPHLERMDLSVGQILCESGSPRTHAYFPTSSIISLVYVTSDGTSTEIASIGNEGLAGVTLIMGASATPLRTLVHCRGEAYRLRAEILTAEFSRGADLHQLLLRYTQARLTLVGQLAVCNQRHSIDQQLCRWLLLRLDRLACEELTMTHEALSNTLGVRREGITEAARKLQSAGLIRYGRGRIRSSIGQAWKPVAANVTVSCAEPSIAYPLPHPARHPRFRPSSREPSRCLTAASIARTQWSSEAKAQVNRMPDTM